MNVRNPRIYTDLAIYDTPRFHTGVAKYATTTPYLHRVSNILPPRIDTAVTMYVHRSSNIRRHPPSRIHTGVRVRSNKPSPPHTRRSESGSENEFIQSWFTLRSWFICTILKTDQSSVLDDTSMQRNPIEVTDSDKEETLHLPDEEAEEE